MEKIYFTIDNIHESLWGKRYDDPYFQVQSIPFYLKGISYNDIISVQIINGMYNFDKVISVSGHSNYRVYIKNENDEGFKKYWQPLENIGCSYENANSKLFAIDVPPKTDIDKVYELLETGEKENFWEFEEGNCEHLIQKN